MTQGLIQTNTLRNTYRTQYAHIQSTCTLTSVQIHKHSAHPISNNIHTTRIDASYVEHYPDECKRLGGARQQCAGGEINVPPRSIATAISGRLQIALKRCLVNTGTGLIDSGVPDRSRPDCPSAEICRAVRTCVTSTG